MADGDPIIDWSTPMFGREQELAQLQEALKQARSGRGSTIFVAGEAGIGKTRLCDEFLATADDCLILRGWCLPESMEPLVPIREALASGNLEQSFTGIVPPKLLSVFLVDTSGMLIAKAERAKSGLDPDIFMGMLSAVGTFVKDTMIEFQGSSTNAMLNSMGYGDYKIMLEAQGSHTLVSILEGHENEKFMHDSSELLRGILTDHAGVLKNWSGEAESIQPIIEILTKFTSSAKFIGRELVTDDPKLRRENLFDNIKLGMQRVSQERTVIMFLDDLQWADPSSLALIHYLARSTEKYPVLILGTYRPEDILKSWEGKPHQFQETLDLLGREDLLSTIEVARLGQGSMRELVRGTFGDFQELDALATRVYAETEGNSFFAKEILKLLVEEGVLVDDDGWKVIQDLDKVHLSKKILEIVERRLRRLPEEDREILECAAIVGSEFDSKTVACTLEQNRMRLAKSLGQIERLHSLIHAIQKRYRFDHAKIREVLYQNTAEDLRQMYHQAIAECFLREHAEDPFQVSFELAYHLDLAGDARAHGFALRAAENAKAEFGTMEARRQFQMALRHCAEPEDMARISEGLADIAELEGDYPGAIDLLKQARGDFPELEDQARTLRKHATVLLNKGDYQEAIDIASKAFELAPVDSLERVRAGYSEIAARVRIGEYDQAIEMVKEILTQDLPDGLVGTGLHWLGTNQSDKGDFDEALENLQKALVIRQTLNDRRGIAGSLNNIGIIHAMRGDLDRALEAWERGLGIFEEIGDKRGIGTSLGNIGLIHSDRGDLDSALEYQEKSLSIKEEIGDKSGIGLSLGNIGIIHQNRGDLDRALEYYEGGLNIQEEIGDKLGIGLALTNIGEIHKDRGDLDRALEYQDRSLSIGEEIGDKRGICNALLGLGDVWFERSDLNKSREYCERALDLSREIGLKEIEGSSLVLKGRLASSAGEDSRVFFNEGLGLLEAGSGEMAEALFRFAEVMAGGSPGEAQEKLSEARAICEKLGNKLWLNRIKKLEHNLGSE